MPWYPIADHGREFSDLKVHPLFVSGRVTKQIFVQPHFRSSVGRVEAAIDTHLPEEIEMLRPLRIDKDRQPRIEKKSLTRVYQRRRSLIDEIGFQINQSADLQLKVNLRVSNRERLIELIQEFRGRAYWRSGKH